MNGFELTARLVGDLAWPVIVVASLCYWRTSITTLLQTVAQRAKSVRGPGFNIELETQMQELASTDLALIPAGPIDDDHQNNVREPVPLSADPVGTIIDSYERARYAATNHLAEHDSTRPANTVRRLADAMRWYDDVYGSINGVLRQVTAEMQSIYDAVIASAAPPTTFSPKERLYATHYQAVAERVVSHFSLLDGGATPSP